MFQMDDLPIKTASWTDGNDLAPKQKHTLFRPWSKD
jgi:hypothetical protein